MYMFGEIQPGPNFFLFGKFLEKDEEDQLLKMRLRNGSVLTERGFYDHFDSIFHDSSRRYNLRAAATDTTRRGRGKEFIIPVRIETAPEPQPTDSRSSRTSNDLASTSNSSERGIEISVTRGCSSQNSKIRRDKSRSPILPQHCKVLTSYKELTPTTNQSKDSNCRVNSSDELDSDITFIKTETGPRKQVEVRATKPESEPEVLEIEDDDTFIRSLCRKPLRHFENTPSVSSRDTVSGKCSEHLTGNKWTNLTSGHHVRSGSDKKEAERPKRPSCSHPGPVDVTAPPSYPAYGYLKPRLAVQDRQIDYIRGDGNCFFRAISKAVYGSEDYHAEYRQAICDLIQSRPELFLQYIDHNNITTHVTNMRVQGTWATTCEIYAAATLLCREIYVLAPSPSSDAEYHWLLFSPRPLTRSTVGRSGGLQKEEKELQPCYVTLCHTNANHYDHVCPISVRCNCQLAVPSLDGVSTMLDLTSVDQEEVFEIEG